MASGPFEHTVVVTDLGAEVLGVTVAGETAVGLPAASIAG